MTTRWLQVDGPRGNEYDARWSVLAEAGQNIHGEADLVQALLAEYGGATTVGAATTEGAASILDAGCGTGRVAIELAHRGMHVVGVDLDAAMLDTARAKAPELTWIQADLTELVTPADSFDLVLLAGNVMIFVAPGTEGLVLANLAGCLKPGGLLVAGFSRVPGGVWLDRYDELATAAGLTSLQRFSTWDRDPFTGGDYAISVHRRAVSVDRRGVPT